MKTMVQKIAEKFFCFSLLILLLTVVGQFALAQPKTESPIPPPPNGGRVGDNAGVLDEQTQLRLETKLKKLRDTTNPSIEMGVAVVRSTNGADIFDYSLAIYRGWGIGSTQQENPGLLLCVAIDDRKYFTQISRDLEGDLTDGEAGQIQRNVLVPAFRQQQYAKGIEDTLDAYIQNIAQTRGFDAAQIVGETGATRPPPRRDTPRSRQPRAQASLGTCCLLLVVGAIILFIISAAGRGRGGGGGGFGGGDLLSGLILGSILSNASRGDGWSGGGFGGGGDSDWGGGDSGWGGFGGGGDAGGGGAGGDW